MFTKLRDVFSSLKGKKEKKFKPVPQSNSIPFDIALSTNKEATAPVDEKAMATKDEMKEIASRGGMKPVYGPFEINRNTTASTSHNKRSKVSVIQDLSKPEYKLLSTLHEAYHHPTVLDVHRDLIWGLLKEKKAKKAAANLNRVLSGRKHKVEPAKVEDKDRKDVVQEEEVKEKVEVEVVEKVGNEGVEEEVTGDVIEDKKGEVGIVKEDEVEDVVEDRVKVIKEEAAQEEVDGVDAKFGVQEVGVEEVKEELKDEVEEEVEVKQNEVKIKTKAVVNNEDVKQPVPPVMHFVYPPMPLLICYDIEKVQEMKNSSESASPVEELPIASLVNSPNTERTTPTESESTSTIEPLASYEPIIQASSSVSALFDAAFAELSLIEMDTVKYQGTNIGTGDDDDDVEWDNDYEFPDVDYKFEVDDDEEYEDRVLNVYGVDWKWVKKVDASEEKGDEEEKEAVEGHEDSAGSMEGDEENWVQNRMSWWKEQMSTGEDDEGVFDRNMGLALEKLGGTDGEEEEYHGQDEAANDQVNEDHFVTENAPEIPHSPVTQVNASASAVAIEAPIPVPRPAYPRTLNTSQLEVVRLLGKGANSKVYVVKDVVSRRHLAVKVVPRYGEADSSAYSYDDVISMLFSEQMLLKKNSRQRDGRRREEERRRISRAFDSLTASKGGEVEGIKDPEDVDWTLWLEASWSDSMNYYLATPLLPTSIDEIVMEVGRIVPSIVRFYTVELIIALEFLHSKGIIHRDIKTANLFVSQTGHLLLGDFGFAKDFHKKPSLPERVFQPFWPYLPGQTIVDSSTPRADPEDLTFVSNLALGSPYEASPEIYLNQYYSFGVDFWAATVSMFYMLTGHPPWYDENPRELRRQVLEDDPVYFDEDPVDEVTRDFVESMLAKEPEDRLRIGPDMRSHGYFAGVDWDRYETQSVPAPWIPPTDAWKHRQCYNAFWDPEGEDALVPGGAFGEDEDPDDGEFDYNSEWVKRAEIDEEAVREEQKGAEEDVDAEEQEIIEEENAEIEAEEVDEEETKAGDEEADEEEVVENADVIEDKQDEHEPENEDLEQADDDDEKQICVSTSIPTASSIGSRSGIEHPFFRASISNINLLKSAQSLRSMASTKSIKRPQQGDFEADNDDKENTPLVKISSTLSSKQSLSKIRSSSSSSLLFGLVSRASHSSLQVLERLPEDDQPDDPQCDSPNGDAEATPVDVPECLLDIPSSGDSNPDELDDTFATATPVPTAPSSNSAAPSIQVEDTDEEVSVSTEFQVAFFDNNDSKMNISEVGVFIPDEAEALARFDATPHPSSQLTPSDSNESAMVDNEVPNENEDEFDRMDQDMTISVNTDRQKHATATQIDLDPEFKKVVSKFASEQPLNLDAPLPSPWSPLPSPWSPPVPDATLGNQEVSVTPQNRGSAKVSDVDADAELASTTVGDSPTKRTTTIQIVQTPVRPSSIRQDSNPGHRRQMSEKVERSIFGNATNVDSRPGTPDGKSPSRKFSLRRAMTVPKSLKVGSPGKDKGKSSPTRSNTIGRFGGSNKAKGEGENNEKKLERSPSSGGVMDKLKGWRKKMMNKVGTKEV